MSSSQEEIRDVAVGTGVCLRFTDGRPLFASVASATEELEIPESLARRCGVLADIRDHDVHSKEDSRDDVPIQLSMLHAKAWLLCGQLQDAAELAKQDVETLLSALKVRRSVLAATST